ncbi:MAG: hypothetical protein ISR96_12140 [Nitrospira sp.]|nr:hypothetical protein [bacterium]MBL7050254.1 hypothetical protein [Nitrospira sp.]
MMIIDGVFKKSAMALVIVALITAWVGPEAMWMSIVIGWLIGVVNLKIMSGNLGQLLGKEGVTPALFFMNILRFTGMLAAIVLLVYYRAVDIFGLLGGLLLVLVFLLVEGLLIKKSG